MKIQLDEQKTKYETVQEKHLADLEEMRKAGQDALAVIVEDYKVLVVNHLVGPVLKIETGSGALKPNEIWNFESLQIYDQNVT